MMVILEQNVMSDHSDVVEFYKYDLVEAQFHNNEWI